MLVSKAELILHILHGQALLFEIAHRQANSDALPLYGEVLERYNSVCTMDKIQDIEGYHVPANVMALEFLNWVYNGGPAPAWTE